MYEMVCNVDSADWVVLDGVVSTGGGHDGRTVLETYDSNFEATLESVLAECGGDAECSRYLGEDPVARVRALFTHLDATPAHCPQLGITTDYLRPVLSLCVQMAPLRPFLAPLLYRLERCNRDDIRVWTQFDTVLSKLLEGDCRDKRLDSTPALYNLIVSWGGRGS
jgi:hypothetical protein